MKGYFMDNTQGPVESVENIHRFPKIETYFFPYGLSLSTNHCFFCLLFNIMLLWAQDALREYAVLHGCLWTPSHNVAGLHPPAAGFSLLKTSGPMCFALVGVEKISQASYSHCLLIQLMADG